jgi:hypothetical protein
MYSYSQIICHASLSLLDHSLDADLDLHDQDKEHMCDRDVPWTWIAD